MAKRPPQIKTQAFLANLAMFSEMGPAELDRIAAATVPLYFEKGQSIVQCGDPCTGFHVVVYGQVKLAFTSPQGVEKVVEIVRPGQSFGEALMFLDKPYIVFAQALADSMLLHVAKHAVLEQLGPDGFGRRMIAGLARRLHGLVRDVEAYTLRSGQDRVIGYLLAELPDGVESGAAEVRLTPGKSVLASRLNMTPEHFSRILHDLAAQGLIEVNGRSIRVADVARLRGASPVS
jgi:CRP-like cAMP-binding protein